MSFLNTGNTVSLVSGLASLNLFHLYQVFENQLDIQPKTFPIHQNEIVMSSCGTMQGHFFYYTPKTVSLTY